MVDGVTEPPCARRIRHSAGLPRLGAAPFVSSTWDLGLRHLQVFTAAQASESEKERASPQTHKKALKAPLTACLQRSGGPDYHEGWYMGGEEGQSGAERQERAGATEDDDRDSSSLGEGATGPQHSVDQAEGDGGEVEMDMVQHGTNAADTFPADTDSRSASALPDSLRAVPEAATTLTESASPVPASIPLPLNSVPKLSKTDKDAEQRDLLHAFNCALIRWCNSVLGYQDLDSDAEVGDTAEPSDDGLRSGSGSHGSPDGTGDLHADEGPTNGRRAGSWNALCDAFNRAYPRLRGTPIRHLSSLLPLSPAPPLFRPRLCHASLVGRPELTLLAELRQPFRTTKRWHEKAGWFIDLPLGYFLMQLGALRPGPSPAASDKHYTLTRTDDDDLEIVTLLPVAQTAGIEDDTMDPETRSHAHQLKNLCHAVEHRPQRYSGPTAAEKRAVLDATTLVIIPFGPGGSVDVYIKHD